MAKKKHDEGGGEGSWLNTYADMITLVLTFFVALYSMSTLKAESQDAIAKGENPGGPTESIGTEATQDPQEGGQPSTTVQVDLKNIEEIEDLSDLMEYVQAYIETNNLQDQVQVKEGEGAVYIRFNSDVFFLPDRYNLQRKYDEEKAKNVVPILEFLGDCFHQIEDQLMMINIYGHTAEVASNNYAVRALMLSSERAASVAIYLQDEKQIPGTLLNPIGQGNSFPIASNDTVDGRAKNRRVDIAIVSKNAQITDAQQVLQLLQGTFDSETYPRTGGVGDVIFPTVSDGQQTELPPESVPEASPESAPENPPSAAGENSNS